MAVVEFMFEICRVIFSSSPLLPLFFLIPYHVRDSLLLSLLRFLLSVFHMFQSCSLHHFITSFSVSFFFVLLFSYLIFLPSTTVSSFLIFCFLYFRDTTHGLVTSRISAVPSYVVEVSQLSMNKFFMSRIVGGGLLQPSNRNAVAVI